MALPQVLANLLTGKQSKAADLGYYFVARTPTIGTGIAGVTSLTTYTAASPVCIIYNGNPAGTGGPNGTGQNIWLDYASFFVTATAASTTSLVMACVLDTGNRWSSAGSTLTSNCMNQGVLNVAGTPQNLVTVYAGALVAAAASTNARIVGTRLIRQQIPVVLDQYILNFGSVDAAPASLPPQALSAAVPSTSSVGMPPVCITPGNCCLIYYYGAGMAAAPSFEIEVGYMLGQ